MNRVFVDKDEGPFVFAQWQHVADTFSITEKKKAKSLVNALRNLVVTDNAALKHQVVDLQREIAELRAEIEDTEAEINELIYEAYGLSPEEQRIVEAG